MAKKVYYDKNHEEIVNGFVYLRDDLGIIKSAKAVIRQGLLTKYPWEILKMQKVLQEYNANLITPHKWCILINDSRIDIQMHYENKYLWRINDQCFTSDSFAAKYLIEIIWEKKTGYRIITHPKYAIPEICGINGVACRCPNECNSALCFSCPVSEEFFAKRDGVKLVYMNNARMCEVI